MLSSPLNSISTSRSPRLVALLAAALPGAGLAAQPPATAPPANIRDFAAAEKALPAAFKGLQGNNDGWNFRAAPDGKHVAWVAVRDGERIDAPGERPLEVLVGDADGAAPRATLLHAAAKWPDYLARGPVWLPDSSGVLVGYETLDEGRLQVARVDFVDIAGERKPFVQQANATVMSIAVSRQGTIVVVFDGKLCVYDRAGRQQSAVDLGAGGGCAAPSPDGRLMASADVKQLQAGEVKGGHLAPVGTVTCSADIRNVPQWLGDGQTFVVATGGGVAHADAEKGLLQQWSERDLGGRAHAVVVLPGDAIAAAIVVREKDGSALQVLLGAGHAPKRTFADLVWLRLADGHSERSKVTVEVQNRGWHSLPYLPRLSELIARYGR